VGPLVPIRSELDRETEPAWFRPTIERLLASLPEGSCQGLGAIVLTRTDITANRPRQRRARTNRKGIALGKYHRGWKGEPAWIELVVDEIITTIPRELRWIRIFRDRAVGQVLFHEIGHHLDAKRLSVGRTGEHGAEAWESRLGRRYLQQRYGYLRPFAPLLLATTRLMMRVVRKLRGRRGVRRGRSSDRPG
jgi:hypothetical protein